MVRVRSIGMFRRPAGSGLRAFHDRLMPGAAVALRCVAATLFLLPLLSVSVGQAAAPQVGSVRFILHGLTVQPPRVKGAPGRVSEPLFAAYGLHTAAGERASIRFVDHTVLHINQRTDLVLRNRGLTMIRRGEVAALGHSGGHERLVTANAVASAVGTEFDVRIQRPTSSYSRPPFPPGTTTVSVVRGIVVVSNALGRVTVTEGHWTHVLPGKAPTLPTRHRALGDVVWTRVLPPPGARP